LVRHGGGFAVNLEVSGKGEILLGWPATFQKQVFKSLEIFVVMGDYRLFFLWNRVGCCTRCKLFQWQS